MEYTVEITTVPEIADSKYLDRLAEIVYAIPILVDPLLGLNENGSVTASFCFAAETPDPIAAAGEAVYAFVQAVAEARPLRIPAPNEVGKGTQATAAGLGRFAGATVGHFGVSLSPEREEILA
jgi:hypothetical protein